MSYDAFKDLIKQFVEEIMLNYLSKLNLLEIKKCSCIVKNNLPIKIRGYYNYDENRIVINEDVIKKIYNGNMTEILVLFHELNHFKTKFDIIKEETSYNLIQILKEMLLREAINQDEKRLTKGMSEDQYYKCNYSLYREENYVNVMAITDLNLFIEKIGIELTAEQTKKLDEILSTSLKNYTDYNRDFTYILTYNNYHMNFEDAFELELKRYPEWLIKFPLLQTEYYKTGEGKIVKRSVEELKNLISEEKNIKKIEFIKYLIMHRYETMPNEQKNENKKVEDTTNITNDNNMEDTKHKLK